MERTTGKQPLDQNLVNGLLYILGKCICTMLQTTVHPSYPDSTASGAIWCSVFWLNEFQLDVSQSKISTTTDSLHWKFCLPTPAVGSVREIWRNDSGGWGIMSFKAPRVSTSPMESNLLGCQAGAFGANLSQKWVNLKATGLIPPFWPFALHFLPISL